MIAAFVFAVPTSRLLLHYLVPDGLTLFGNSNGNALIVIVMIASLIGGFLIGSVVGSLKRVKESIGEAVGDRHARENETGLPLLLILIGIIVYVVLRTQGLTLFM